MAESRKAQIANILGKWKEVENSSDKRLVHIADKGIPGVVRHMITAEKEGLTIVLNRLVGDYEVYEVRISYTGKPTPKLAEAFIVMNLPALQVAMPVADKYNSIDLSKYENLQIEEKDNDCR